MTLTGITEMWVRAPDTETKGEMIAPLYTDRVVPRMHLEGTSILSILKIKEQAPSSNVSQAAATHERLEIEGNTMPGKGHRHCDLENHPDGGQGQDTGARPKVYSKLQYTQKGMQTQR